MFGRLKHFIIIYLCIMISLGVFGTAFTVHAEETEQEISGDIEVIFNRKEEDMQPYIDAFEEKYPGVEVTYTCYGSYESSIKQRMEEGDYGDVLFFPTYADSNKLKEYFAPLGDYISLSEKYNYVDQGQVYNNIVYGIPSSAYLVGVVYNREVFDKAGVSTTPTSTDEFLYAMYLVKEHTDAIPFYVGYNEPWILEYWEIFPYVEMTGSPGYKYNEFLVDVNPFREGTVHNRTLMLLYDLVENGYTEVGSESIAWWDSVVAVNEGRVGCAVVGTWALHDYKTAGEYGNNIAFMPFPNTVDGKQYVTVTADYSYAVARNSENKEAAKAFVNFMLEESGYAFEHDTISILKSDPYPECYGDMTQTTVLNTTSASDEAYAQYDALSSRLDLGSQDEYKRIIEAASGKSDESFDDIMTDWNERWESSRASWMTTSVETTSTGSDDLVLVIANTQVEFSENEAKYIVDNSLVRVGYHRNMAPLSYEEDGEFLGIARDICNIISEKSSLNMEYYGYDSTDALKAALEAGEIDFIAGMEKSSDDAGIKYSKEYLQYMDVLVRHDTTDGTSLKKYVSVDGEAYYTLDETQQNVSCPTISNGIDFVQNMKADFLITNYYSANYYIRQNDCDDLTVIPYENNRTYHIGFSEDTSPVLIAICNKCIYSIQTGEVEIALMEYMDTVVQDVTLETFIKANPLLSLAIVTVVFLMLFMVFFERYKAKKRQALDAKKYELLSSLADEHFFEYNYKKEQFKFDSKFVDTLGFEPVVTKSQYHNENPLQNQFMEQIDFALEKKSDTQFNIVLNKEDGVKQWYRIITSVVLNRKKQPIHLLGKIINIQKEMEEVENYQDKARRDPLTRLYNREGLAAHMPKEASQVMLAVMDMDNFKMVNDTLGHDGGDYALTYFADTLRQRMGEKSLIARYGGDEFVVVLIETTAQEAEERLAELVKNMNVELKYAGNVRKVSISVGAVYTENMNSFEELFSKADKVLYKTKEAGKNNYRLERI